MPRSLHTAWQGPELVVTRDDQVIDKIAADQIRRAILVCKHGGDTPGDLSFAVIETPEDFVILPADSGVAGRIHFERQAFWSEKACIYWVAESRAQLPGRLRPGVWILRRQRPGYMRLPLGELQSVVEQWPLEGPQTWEQRKWERIVRSRLLTPAQGKQPKQQS